MTTPNTVRSLPQPQRVLDYNCAPTEGGFLSSCRDVLSAHKRLFGVCIAACLATSAVYSFSRVPCYRARGVLELQVPPTITYGAATRDGQSQGVSDGQSFSSYLDAQMGILQSDTLIRRVIVRSN